MLTVSLKIPEEVDRRVAVVARRAGISKSAVIREAIEERLAKTPRSATASFLDLAADLAGCVDGPEDLASHAKHMAGYGG